MPRAWLPVLVGSLGFLLGCPSSAPSGAKPEASGSSPSAPSKATTPARATPGTKPKSSAPAPSAAVSAKPKPAPKPYTGKTGTLRGVVRITGDEAPKASWIFPKGCEGAAGTYGRLFRTGLGDDKKGKTVADAIVAVTNYRGYVPAAKPNVDVTIKHCAFSTRSIALGPDQHIEVRNLEGIRSFVPHLEGSRNTALNVAVPNGVPIKLRAQKPGRFWLRDQMGRKFMVAHVFKFRFATTDVTALDGAYEIKGIPVGKVNVSAMLPAAKLLSTTQKEVVIKEGNNRLDLVLEFDKAKHVPNPIE